MNTALRLPSKMGLDSEICPTTIAKIPESILLEILRYLPVKDRCLAARVCKQWRRIVHDNSLWQHVDLLKHRLDLKQMWKVLRTHFSPSLQTIKIGGYARAGMLCSIFSSYLTDSSKRNKTSVSDAVLTELATRCPNLWMLHLHECNIDSLSFESLPSSIKSLNITNSTWQPRWLKDKQNHLPNLESLNLHLSIRVDSFDLQDIAMWTNLKTLSLSGCYRVKGAGVQVIVKKLKELESLNLSGCDIDNLTIHHIARHLKNLRELFLASCSWVDDSSLATLAAGLPKLLVLDISDCNAITMKGLESLFVTKLKYLTVVRNNRLQEEEIRAVKKGFSDQIVLTV